MFKKETVYRVNYYHLPEDARDAIYDRHDFGNDRTLELTFRYVDQEWETDLLASVQQEYPEFSAGNNCLLVDICW